MLILKFDALSDRPHKLTTSRSTRPSGRVGTAPSIFVTLVLGTGHKLDEAMDLIELGSPMSVRRKSRHIRTKLKVPTRG